MVMTRGTPCSKRGFQEGEDQRCIIAAGIDTRMSMIKSLSFISRCFSGLAE